MKYLVRRKPKIARAETHLGRSIGKEIFFAAALILTACILCWSVPASGSPATELDQGKAYLREGSYPQAVEILQSAFRQDPADPEINFQLGRAAFESGDYETAAMAFERVLIMNPQAQRAKLELARSFYQLGDLESAGRYFREVLATEPPETVRLNIENFLTHIAARQKRQFFSGSLALGTGWDDNVRAAPAEDRIQTALGDVILSGKGAKPEGDRVDTVSLQLNHAFTLRPDTLSWQSTLISYNAFHADADDLDLNFFSLTTGPVLRRDDLLLQFYGLANYLLLDSDRYLGSFGAGASVRTVGTSLLQWSAALKAEKKTFFSIPEKDATNVSLLAGPVLQWGPNRLTLSGLAERENAEGDENSYDRLGVIIGADRQLPAGFALGLEFRFQDTSYDEASFLFTQSRDDDLIEVNVEISKQLWRSAHNRQTLLARLRDTYSESRSNQDLYDYDKNTIAATINYFF